MKAKCLLIGSTKYNYQDINPEPVKYALLSLMSHIVDIADVEIIDFEVLFGFPRTINEIMNFREFVKSILKGKPADIVAVSCYTSFDYLATIDILKICRDLFKKATLVVGGYHPTALPEDFFGKNNYADFIIRGEGEEALREIIISNGKNLPQVIVGNNLELGNEKPLRYDLYPYKTNELYISLSRGCFHKCAFCVQSDNYINKYRKMDLEKIKDKIDRAVKYFPIERLLFTDPIFGIDYEQTEMLVEFLIQKYPNYSYWAETRIDRLSEKLVSCLSKLKIDLHFGVESLAEDTLLNLMNKTNNANYYNECFLKSVELCQKYNVLGLFGFIMNYPGEKAESSQYTLSQIQSVIEKYSKLNVTFHINQYALYPGNQIYDMRDQLIDTRGFYFPNDGWWRSSEPNIRKRSESCIASTSINDTYNGNNHYWHAEKNILLRQYTAKFSMKAYQFYQRDEVRSIINSYDKELKYSKNYEQIQNIVAKYRYSLSNIFTLYYENMKENVSKEYIETFNKLFIHTTSDMNNQIIRAYLEGMNKNEIDRKVNSYIMMLQGEYENNISNISNISKNQKTCDVILVKNIYRITIDGKVERKKE